MHGHRAAVPTVAIAVVLTALPLGCTSDANAGFSCEELEAREDVEFLLCDDGETHIDRRDELAPHTPTAEATE